jgi:hypothetical protein
MLEKVKNGDPLIYGGRPWKSFESHMDGQAEAVLERTEYGHRWRFHERGGLAGRAKQRIFKSRKEAFLVKRPSFFLSLEYADLSSQHIF